MTINNILCGVFRTPPFRWNDFSFKRVWGWQPGRTCQPWPCGVWENPAGSSQRAHPACTLWVSHLNWWFFTLCHTFIYIYLFGTHFHLGRIKFKHWVTDGQGSRTKLNSGPGGSPVIYLSWKHLDIRVTVSQYNEQEYLIFSRLAW